jgi:hypothetical protein
MPTWKKYYIGGSGPFYYDEDRSVDDPDGDFAGENYNSVLTDGAAKAEKFTATGIGTDPEDLPTNSQVDTKLNNLSLSVTTTTKTVITGVDFTTETVTTEDITYVTNVTLNGQP